PGRLRAGLGGRRARLGLVGALDRPRDADDLARVVVPSRPLAARRGALTRAGAAQRAGRERRPRTASPKRPAAKSAAGAGSGTGFAVVAYTGPVFPVLPMMSATKTLPRLFLAIRSAIVALATWNTMSLPNLSLAPPPHVVHAIPNANDPVPSPLKAPVCAARVSPETV